MAEIKISKDIKYIGVDDKDLDLFESQYVIPEGISYNSYVIIDEQILVMDTVDVRKTEDWMNNLKKVLGEKTVNYLVISHMEPDHAASIMALKKAYPHMKIVGNIKTFQIFEQFFGNQIGEEDKILVKEGDTLSTGSHTLQFFLAPMVHWPEVMVTYESSEKILFSADGFGKFGALDIEADWTCEARRYYFNIVGKYGNPVQNLLKKAKTLDIQTICPLHGPILKENLQFYIDKYQIWSSYEPEDEGVLIAYASIHGNTARTAEKLGDLLKKKGVSKVVVSDLAREDMAEVIEDAFRYDRMVLAAATYDGGLFPCMEEFLHHLKSKAYQNRTVAYIENGSWGPLAGKCMKDLISGMKNITEVEPTITIRSAMNEENEKQLEIMAEELSK